MIQKKFFIFIFIIALSSAIWAGHPDTIYGAGTTEALSEETAPAANSETLLVSDEVTQTKPLGIENFPDRDALAKAYVQRHSSSVRMYSRRISVGSRLTGQNKILYDRCRARIQKVADGTDDDGDGRIPAIVTIPVRDLVTDTLGDKLVDDPDNNRTYVLTADLGITQKITRDTLPISNETVRSLFDYDIRTVVNALLADCPYDLYWFDKEQNINRTTQPYYSVATSSDGTQKVCFDNTRSTVSIRFVVSADYAASSSGSSDDRYMVDAAKTGAAVIASTNARQIVKDTESKGLSDLQVLQKYQQTICDLTDYDYDISPVQPYGDPWQMIYVFDNDPSTKVTCEGYAKAMQYLCDETDFQDSSITCLSVTGYLGYGPSVEGHMWNIIHWSDGNNYLVDVTNCDSGTAGSGGKLFMVPVNYVTKEELPQTLADQLPQDLTEFTAYKATVDAGTDSESTLYYIYDNQAFRTFTSDELSVYTADLSVSEDEHIIFSWKDSGLNDGSGYTLSVQDGTSVRADGTSASISDLPAGDYTATVSEMDILGRTYISSPVLFSVKEQAATENTATTSTTASTTAASTTANTATTSTENSASEDNSSEITANASTESPASESKKSENTAKDVASTGTVGTESDVQKESDKEKTSASTSTGDRSPILLYIVLSGAAAAGLILVTVKKKR